MKGGEKGVDYEIEISARHIDERRKNVAACSSSGSIGIKSEEMLLWFPFSRQRQSQTSGGGGGDADEFCGEVAYSRTKYAKNSEIASEDTSASTEVVREAERERERHTYYWEWERKVKGAL